jgi:hypothetical protein
MTPSAEIKVLSSLATREAYLELVPQFERASGRKVETTWARTVDIIKRISAGESFDLIIAANSTIDDFILPGGSKPPAGSISLAPVSESPCNEGRNGRTSAQPKHASVCCLPTSRLATRPARAVSISPLSSRAWDCRRYQGEVPPSTARRDCRADHRQRRGQDRSPADERGPAC